MKAPKKFHPEVEAPTPDNNEMEKNLISLRAIRKSRLDRKEAEYRQSVAGLNCAKADLQKAISSAEEIKIKVKQEKKTLQKKQLNSIFTPITLQHWFAKESQLDDEIFDAIQIMRNASKQVTNMEQIVKNTKKIYNEGLLSIEKLDLLTIELRKENENQ